MIIHHSLCITLSQALLEYHLFQPPTPPGGAAALLRMFRAFWDSTAPLIGDQGSRGWAYWCCWHAMGMEQPTAAAAAAAEVEEVGQATQQVGLVEHFWVGLWFLTMPDPAALLEFSRIRSCAYGDVLIGTLQMGFCVC